MNGAYFKAVKSLYGDTCEVPATNVLPKARSSSHGKKKRQIEGILQTYLVNWAISRNLPIFSIPNEGNRGRMATHRLKQMGLRPGAADLFLARPSRGYSGFFIEMKSPGERPRANQVQFLEDMRKEGYRAEWFDDWETARQAVMDYLGWREHHAK